MGNKDEMSYTICMQSPSLSFSSYFWAGYECAYALIKKRGGGVERLDLLKSTKHDEYCRMDYTLIKNMGIMTVREGFSWNQIDKGNNTYQFDRFESLMRIAQEEGIQQIWNLNHFDFPEYLDPFSDQFIIQFAEYSKRCVDTIRKYQKGTLYINPINEISFFSWIGAEVGGWAPFAKAKGVLFKRQLVKAALAAMDAMWKVDKNIRFIQIDPLMYRKAKKDMQVQQMTYADNFNSTIRFQTFDMLSGRLEPDLGGDPKYLDIIGLNYYFHNQEWIYQVRKTNPNLAKSRVIPFLSTDRLPVTDLLDTVYERYHRPMIISETGSYGNLRSRWWNRILREIDKEKNILDLHGICIYPAVDRQDWANKKKLTNSGIWDFKNNDPAMVRVPHEKSIAIIKKYIRKWKKDDRTL